MEGFTRKTNQKLWDEEVVKFISDYCDEMYPNYKPKVSISDDTLYINGNIITVFTGEETFSEIVLQALEYCDDDWSYPKRVSKTILN